VATTTTLPRTSDGVLTLDELAVLMITSPAHISPKAEETVIVTSKDAYLWAIIFSEIADRDDEPDHFLSLFRDYVSENADVFRLLYETISSVEREGPAQLLLDYMTASYGLSTTSVAERANAACTSLVEKGLIEDPFKKKIAIFVLCVSGLMPTSFTSTTKAGGVRVQTYHSRLLDVEHHKSAKQESTKIEFKVVDMAQTVYPKMMDIVHDIVGGDGPKKKAPTKPTGHD
jgi:hypothetical protein